MSRLTPIAMIATRTNEAKIERIAAPPNQAVEHAQGTESNSGKRREEKKGEIPWDAVAHAGRYGDDRSNGDDYWRYRDGNDRIETTAALP
jgi:hypothetical protein